MQGLETLAALVAEKTGFDTRALSEARLRKLEKVLRTEGCAEGAEAAFPRFEELAAEALSVGETYFYRQSEHFEFLQQQGLQWSRSMQPFLAWSAGCASGEEAWSLAACLKAVLPEGRPLEVLGTDMSARNLGLAREGRYGKWSLRRESEGLPPVLKGRPEEMEVLGELRPLARFERANLLDPPPLGGRKADIIFCRNVLIYLSPAAVRRVVGHLVEALAEGGLLLLGSVDIDFSPEGLALEDPRLLQIWRKAPLPKAAAAAAPQAPETEPLVDAAEAFDARAAHLAALEMHERGDEAAALQSLFELRLRAPAYLPGIFDLGLALSRRGAKREAAATFETLLEAAAGKDLEAQVEAPEPVSLNFYVTSAQAFLERYGKSA